MTRTAVFVYGSVCYLLFLGTFLYAIGFVANWIVPKSIDTGEVGPRGAAILVNVLLLGLFAVQHTIMARPAFKAWWTRIIPAAAERSTFVLASCACLCLMFWQWRPMPEIIWDPQYPVVRGVLYGLCALGFGIVLYSTMLIDHFDLFGLRQVVLHVRKKDYTHPPFMERSLYRLIRHPLMLGFIIAFWATPTMTAGHLLFAIVTTGYMLFGIQVEERDLVRFLGDDYNQYRKRTPMLLPRAGRS
jgi:protein-S-isoprenylcysteine O-methyltransferase Ste14